MLYNKYKKKCIEEAKKAVAEYNKTVKVLNERQEELNVIRKRSSDLIHSVESYINTIANVPRELAKEFEEIHLTTQEYNKEVSRLEETAYLSDNVEKVIAGAGIIGFIYNFFNGIRGKKGDDEKKDDNLFLLLIWLGLQLVFFVVVLIVNKRQGDKANSYTRKIWSANKENIDKTAELEALKKSTNTQYEGVLSQLDCLKALNIVNYKKVELQTRQELGTLVHGTWILSEMLIQKVIDE